ncbi:hypothetical protein ACP275_06G146300 [Erythranthe tilingii]
MLFFFSVSLSSLHLPSYCKPTSVLLIPQNSLAAILPSLPPFSIFYFHFFQSSSFFFYPSISSHTHPVMATHNQTRRIPAIHGQIHRIPAPQDLLQPDTATPCELRPDPDAEAIF